MLTEFYESIGVNSPTAVIIISVSLMLFLGFLMTRITKLLRLPNVTAYITVGILVGPYCLNLVPTRVIDGMDFISDIALAFIAFTAGEFFRLSVIKKNGIKVVVIALFEVICSSVLVFVLTFFVLKINVAISAVLAALAAATAPTSTIVTIRQTRAKGDFVNTLLQVIAIDDIIGLMAYSAAISFALAYISTGSKVELKDVLLPIAVNVGVMALGCIFGFIMKLILDEKRSTDNRLIVSIAFLLAFCGVCAILDVSPLLGCMTMGTVYINITNDDKLFKQINYFSPPIMLLFFVRSGICFDLGSLTSSSTVIGGAPLVLIGVLCFAARNIGKYFGAFMGCAAAGKPKETKNYMGLALIPQAGVAIGLAAIGARTLGGEVGSALHTIILISSILNEFVGPACAKASLYLSGSYSNVLEEIASVEDTGADGKKKSDIEILIERIQKIKEEIPEHSLSPEEQAFNEAAEAQYEYVYPHRRKNNLRRR